MKRVMYSDVKVDTIKGCLKLPPSPVMRKESNNFVEFLPKNSYNELNNMFKLTLIANKKNCFEQTEEFTKWFEPDCKYEIYQVFHNEKLEEVYLKKK